MLKVDIFVSRNLDSRFSWREVSSVADWLLSDQPIHVMRDYKPGHNKPILGALDKHFVLICPLPLG